MISRTFHDRGWSFRLWLVTGAMALGSAPAPAQNTIPAKALAQIQALLEEKQTRTAAQLKLDSQIHYSAKMERGEAIAPGVPRLESARAALERGGDGLVHVDIAADVNPDLLDAIAAAGGRVESSYSQYNAIRAWLPLLACEAIAARPDVRFIRPEIHPDRRPTVSPSQREAAVREQLAGTLPALAGNGRLHPMGTPPV